MTMRISVDLIACFIYTIKQESHKGCVDMTNTQKLLKLAQENNGIVTNAMVVSVGIPRGTLKYLSDTHVLEKVARGVYTLPEAWEDEFVNIQTQFKRGIFSLGTALFLCDLTDRTPSRFHMVFPSTYNLSGPKRKQIICSSSKEPLYSLGVVDLKTPGGNTVRGYCAERSLCDVLRPRNHVDIQVISDAFKRYASWKRKNIPLLSEFARRLRVEEKLRTYLEVLL